MSSQSITIGTGTGIPRPPLHVAGQGAIGGLVVLGIGAIAGGAALLAAPDGSVMHFDTSLLAGSPFRDFLLPGLILGGVFGVGSLAVAVAGLRRARWAPFCAFAIGCGQMIWIAVELAIIRELSFLHPTMFAIGLLIAVASVAWGWPTFRAWRALRVNRMPLATRKEVVPMLTVRDVMKPHVMHVAPETPLKDVAQVLIDRRISGVPVVDAQGTVVGVVSEADFLIKEQGVDAVSHRPLSRWFGDSVATKTTLSKLAAVTAGEAMTTPAITIEPTASISLAAQTMTKRRVNRLPVVDGGELVGIVTRSDLLRAYVLPDDDLEATIRDDVMRKLLWLDPALFTIVVRDGIVSVGGRVELHSTAESIGRAIAMVPGVIDLQTTVRWSVEDDDIRPVEREPAFPYSPH